jgi:hypothetical protein
MTKPRKTTQATISLKALDIMSAAGRFESCRIGALALQSDPSATLSKEAELVFRAT